MNLLQVSHETNRQPLTVHLDLSLLSASVHPDKRMGAWATLKAHEASVVGDRHRITFSSEGVNGITCEVCQDILLQAWA